MAEIFDIAIGDEFDLAIESGDFDVKESTPQHQKCLLVAAPGNYLIAPGVGVDLYGHINNDESAEAIKKEVQKQFEADGMKIESLRLSNGNIDVKAVYNA